MRKFVSILCLLLLSACATVVPGYDYHGKDDKLAQLPEHRALVETMGGYQSFSSDEVSPEMAAYVAYYKCQKKALTGCYIQRLDNLLDDNFDSSYEKKKKWDRIWKTHGEAMIMEMVNNGTFDTRKRKSDLIAEEKRKEEEKVEERAPPYSCSRGKCTAN